MVYRDQVKRFRFFWSGIVWGFLFGVSVPYLEDVGRCLFSLKSCKSTSLGSWAMNCRRSDSSENKEKKRLRRRPTENLFKCMLYFEHFYCFTLKQLYRFFKSHLTSFLFCKTWDFLIEHCLEQLVCYCYCLNWFWTNPLKDQNHTIRQTNITSYNPHQLIRTKTQKMNIPWVTPTNKGGRIFKIKFIFEWRNYFKTFLSTSTDV